MLQAYEKTHAFIKLNILTEKGLKLIQTKRWVENSLDNL